MKADKVIDMLCSAVEASMAAAKELAALLSSMEQIIGEFPMSGEGAGMVVDLAKYRAERRR